MYFASFSIFILKLLDLPLNMSISVSFLKIDSSIDRIEKNGKKELFFMNSRLNPSSKLLVIILVP